MLYVGSLGMYSSVIVINVSFKCDSLRDINEEKKNKKEECGILYKLRNFVLILMLTS